MLLRSLLGGAARPLRSHASGAWIPSTSVTAAVAAAAAAAAATAASCAVANTSGMTENRVLGPGPHRVAVTQFTLLSQNGKPSGQSSFRSFDDLCAWVKKHGCEY